MICPQDIYIILKGKVVIKTVKKPSTHYLKQMVTIKPCQ